MGNTRSIGLSIHLDRDEERRRTKEGQRVYENQIALNKWAFRSSCLKRRHGYNRPDSQEPTDGDDPERPDRSE